MCYQTKLTRADIEDMDVGQILDYIDEYLKNVDPKRVKKRGGAVRSAGQNDFDNF